MGDNEQTADEFKLDTLWAEYQKRYDIERKDKFFNVSSLWATPERIGIILVLMNQGLISADTIKQFLSIFSGVK
jgi:hypothetical protein